ncbi:MAG: carotenoid 1,2-hydratase [Deltaproteobacteria bacterium]|nr:carotenoid 1,2-hydratase [Deltaproteobacteria bacterium]
MKHIVPLFLLFAIWVAGTSAAQGEDEWKRVIGPRVWAFPKDHGAHPEYRTEWWYFTGNLKDDAGSRYGYQLTFFRQGIRREVPSLASTWDIRDLYLAHFAITDVSRGRFRFLERISRAGPGLAGAQTDGMDVWVLNWSVRMKRSAIFLEASGFDMELELELTPGKPLVLHGLNGVSKKGPAEGQASYYTSFTNLKTQGFLKTHSGGSRMVAKGRSWFDHEFGSNQLSPDQKGWDWFSLHLSDGRDMMIYFLRLKDGSIEPTSSGTLVERDGTARHLGPKDILISVLDQWKSPQSGGVYPSRWRIQIPSAGIDLLVTPLVADQELNTEVSTGVIYWEGIVAGQGTSRGRKVSCEGYVELTGYAGSMGGLF